MRSKSEPYRSRLKDSWYIALEYPLPMYLHVPRPRGTITSKVRLKFLIFIVTGYGTSRHAFHYQP